MCLLLSLSHLVSHPHPSPGWLGDRGIPSQFTPAIRPFLQTLSIGLVSFGEHYKRNETGLSEWWLSPIHILSCPPFLTQLSSLIPTRTP